MNQTPKNGIWTVVIVDDHEIFRQGLKILIKGFENLTVIGSLTDGRQLQIFLSKQIPDIIIMDINMPNIDGITATEFVRDKYPNIKIIALTMYSDSFTIDRAFKAGVSAYLTKSITKKIFCEAIQSIMNGKPYISYDAAINYTMDHLNPQKNHLKKDIGNSFKPYDSKIVDLNISQRDVEIVQFIAKGYTSAEIGEILHLSPRSIEKYRAQLMKKLHVKNATELVKLFMDKGLF